MKKDILLKFISKQQQSQNLISKKDGGYVKKWQILQEGGDVPLFPIPSLYEAQSIDRKIPRTLVNTNIPKNITKEEAEYLEEQARTKSGYVPVAEQRYNPVGLGERIGKNIGQLGQMTKPFLQAGAGAAAASMAAIPYTATTVGGLLGQAGIGALGAGTIDYMYENAGGKFLGDALDIENPTLRTVANFVSPGAIAGLGNIGSQKMFDMTDLNPFRFKKSPALGGVDDVGKSFKSEIDWGKWNSEIPQNKPLMQEYNAIEQQAKANGTWMKNPDGSVFQGTPEQFVQQNSQNFKKAFPEGYEEVWRGANNDVFIDRDGKSIFAANKDLAKDYVGMPGIDKFYNPNVEGSLNPGRNLFNLAHKKSSKSIELDNFAREWTSIDLTNPKQSVDNIKLNIKNLTEHLEKQKKFLQSGKQNADGSWSFPDTDIKYANSLYEEGTKGQERMINAYKDRLKNIDNIVNNEPELEKMRKVLGSKTTTDDIAKYIETNNLDFVKIKNVNDGGFGDVSIVAHKKGNYLKSLIGNNGMFDMTNPNIYKGLALPVLGASALQSQQEKKQTGGETRKWKIIN